MRYALVAIATVAAAGRATAQDYRFTREIQSGGTLEIDNINGPIDVTRASGRTVEVTVVKVVKRGDGSLVKAIMEGDGRDMRVCTIYLNYDRNRNTCHGDNNINNDRGKKDALEVEMRYSVKVPLGARLTVDDVNGNITVSGADVDARITTVNGDITFEGAGASSLETVSGKITGTFSRANWEGSMSVSTVNGAVDLTFPASLSAEVSGETVNGNISTDFPIRIERGFGPKSFSGRIGSGGRRLKIETVNGGITLRKG